MKVLFERNKDLTLNYNALNKYITKTFTVYPYIKFGLNSYLFKQSIFRMIVNGIYFKILKEDLTIHIKVHFAKNWE